MTLKEIRIHGRGGMGSVKAAEALVYAAVMDGKYGNSIPFFGFERQGAPVTAFVRISSDPIRPKNRVYNPDIVIVLDPTIMNAVDVFEGIKENGTLVLNTTHKPEDLKLPKNVNKVAFVDATAIALQIIGKPITNTVMLGAFCKATGLVSIDEIAKKVEELWGHKNKEALYKGYDEVKVTEL
jgi:pyruvate ferredoxin oxidoreductase gamma subunit/phenylglyoxylate dehydrogenase gamma subunit